MVSEHEKLIGVRLRAFRETLQIPRARFAVRIGFGSDRIASYEAGRAPLLYGVFLAVLENYSLNPQWLATGNGSPQCAGVLKKFCNDAVFFQRESFLDVYSRCLEAKINSLMVDAKHRADQLISKIEESNVSLFQIDPESLTAKERRTVDRSTQEMTKHITELKADMTLRQALRGRVGKILADEGLVKTDLTEAATSPKLGEVKPALPKLLERLQRATADTGKMSELAAWLGVPLASVSRWLSGKREPGGEITLRLLHWVEQQERQK